MAYTTVTFGAGNEYSAKYPTGRLYCFSPYYVEITTESAGQEVTMTGNGFTFMRVSDANKKAKFPISALLQSFFAGVEYGDVLPADTGVYNNTGSKLVKTNKTITFQVDEDVNVFTGTWDVVWGALQQGETEKTTDEIYACDTGSGFLPLTVTSNMGDLIGKDVWISDLLDDTPATSQYQLFVGATPVKTYTIVQLPYCSGGHYLRWISPTGEYRYFYFLPGLISEETTDGAELKQTVWSLEASTEDQIKSDVAIKNKTSKPFYEATVLNATYNQQIHLFGLQRAIKSWVYEGSVWIECRVSVEGLSIDRFRKPKEIVVKIQKSNLYLQSL